MPRNGGFEVKKMHNFNGKTIFLLIIIIIPAVLALHKSVRTVVVPTTPKCLAGSVIIKHIRFTQHNHENHFTFYSVFTQKSLCDFYPSIPFLVAFPQTFLSVGHSDILQKVYVLIKAKYFYANFYSACNKETFQRWHPLHDLSPRMSPWPWPRLQWMTQNHLACSQGKRTQAWQSQCLPFYTKNMVFGEMSRYTFSVMDPGGWIPTSPNIHWGYKYTSHWWPLYLQPY